MTYDLRDQVIKTIGKGLGYDSITVCRKYYGNLADDLIELISSHIVLEPDDTKAINAGEFQ